MALSSLEKKRQENIRRNKELLSKLDLDALSSGISRDIEKSSSPQPVKKKKVVKPKNETKEERLNLREDHDVLLGYNQNSRTRKKQQELEKKRRKNVGREMKL